VRLVVTIAGLVTVLMLAIPGGGQASQAGRPNVTFIGDSVAASLLVVPEAKRRLSKGLDLRLDLKVCRRLVAPSCTYQGETPATALEVVQRTGSGLGEVVVIMVGYNDAASQYRAGVDRVMRALRKAGVGDVVWATLGETRENYGLINGVIRKAATRWSELTVADWAALSRGKPWFAGDGLHLEPEGATALARLIRGKVLAVS
jgi:lysophospholipase L1-like esterase